MSIEFFKALLSFDFYNKYKSLITEELIPKEFQSLYKTILKSHELSKTSLTTRELLELHKSYNPTLSNSQIGFLLGLITNLDQCKDFSLEVQENILFNKVASRISDELAMAAIDIGENKGNYSLEQAQILIDKLKKIKSRKDDTQSTSINVRDLFTKASDLQWKFNLPDLQTAITGIGPGYFGIIGARPDTGKTGFYISLTAAPGGWLEQGADVHVIGNEEAIDRIKSRMLSSLTGETTEYLREHIEEAETAFEPFKDKLHLKEGFGMSIAEIESYLTDKKCDILIIDQLDKVYVGGKYGTNEEKLRVIYVLAREIAKKYKCAVIGICQASFAAHNRLYYGFECLEGSKTGKAAECDWCITIGMEAGQGAGDNGYRVANIPKNKITGRKTPVNFILQPEISRIHA